MPDISFIIASYNAAAFLEAAVHAALDQRGVSVEVLIVDDGSTDSSIALAATLAATDSRVRTFRTARNLGPGGARNVGLDAARGRWIAILDSDDLLHPDRGRRLLDEAEASGADMIADDLLLFDDARIAAPTLFLDAGRAAAPTWIGLTDYLDETRMYGRRPNLGFLKPMIRADRLRERAIRYDERLRIAEDDALIVALLRDGARYRLLPQPLYFYRKHGASISHRLSSAHADLMRDAGGQLVRDLAGNGDLVRALAPRDRALRRAWAFAHLTDALKRRDAARALALAARHPAILPMLRAPLGGAVRKLVRKMRPVRVVPRADPRRVVILARQSIVGASDGASAYLIELAHALRAAGLRPCLFQLSAAVFARTPVLRLPPEMAVFDSIEVRGGMRIGDHLVARVPGIWLAAARGVIAARRLPPPSGAPFGCEDVLAIAAFRQARPATIPAGEARRVADRVPGTQVVRVPMPAPVVAAPQAGRDDRLLFVGGDTASNVAGLRWFFDSVWGLVRARNAAAELWVAGPVAHAFDAAPDGVRLLGPVADPAAVYRDAGIVISPLRQDPGLGIDLVEALAQGKVGVATPVALQGIAPALREALVEADAPDAFADVILSLQRDPARRERLAAAGLAAARREFGPERCLTQFTRRLTAG